MPRIARLLRFRARDLSWRQSGAPEGPAAARPRARAKRKSRAFGPTVTTTSGPTAWRDPQVARCEMDAVYGAETCVRVGARTRSRRGRRDSLLLEIHPA